MQCQLTSNNNIYKNTSQLETESKLEADEFYKTWNQGAYNFLLQRTENQYIRKKTKERRVRHQEESGYDFPVLTDSMLIHLYEKAREKHKRACSNQFAESGYQDTKHERAFKRTLEKIIKSDRRYSSLELYPSQSRQKGIEPNGKMIIGNLIPDFIVFGIKNRGCTSVCFEINGDSHIQKYSKDMKKETLLESLGVRTLPIENDKSNDYKYIKSIIDDLLKSRSGALDKQIQINKRKIWTKTITCNLSLFEIEKAIRDQFNVELNLIKEARLLSKDLKCPRTIKRELKNEDL